MRLNTYGYGSSLVLVTVAMAQGVKNQSNYA